MDSQLDASLLGPIERIARFIETCDDANLTAFADRDVVIIENFPPHVFAGRDAVPRWAAGMRLHVRGLSELTHRFGAPQNLLVTADTAFVSLPTHWSGRVDGRRFDEDGGWAFVLVQQRGEWRVRNYGWAVTDLEVQEPA